MAVWIDHGNRRQERHRRGHAGDKVRADREVAMPDDRRDGQRLQDAFCARDDTLDFECDLL